MLAIHAQHRADHVIILSLGGGKPAALHESDMPTIKRLVAERRGDMDSEHDFRMQDAAVAHVDACRCHPKKHHVDWNNYEPMSGKVRRAHPGSKFVH